MQEVQRPSIASAALAAGRPAVASSFRFHRPRGPVCGRGHCFACEVDTPAGRVLACETDAELGSPRRRDRLRPLGRVAERWPPWFWERRFLANEPVRRLSLEALRRLSAAGPLGPAARPEAPRPFAVREAETVVVGTAAPGDEALVVDRARGDLALGLYGERALGALLDGQLVEIRFRRLVVATGGYERLPPIAGNDLPGVLGLAAAERYAAAGGLAPGLRIACWGPRDAVDRAAALAERHRLELVWSGSAAPRALAGRGRVERLVVDGEPPCDLFLTGVVQPAVELAVQAGARQVLTAGELPILAVVESPAWLELRGAAAGRSSGVPDVPADDDAFACLCEDVRVRDLRACVADGFGHPELVKRRTGALTGPCQGKLCAGAVLGVLRDLGVDAVPTTTRPLARPVTLAELAARA